LSRVLFHRKALPTLGNFILIELCTLTDINANCFPQKICAEKDKLRATPCKGHRPTQKS